MSDLSCHLRRQRRYGAPEAGPPLVLCHSTMDDHTRARKLARLRRLRSQVADLEAELAMDGALLADTVAVGGAAMEVEQGGGDDPESDNDCASDATTSDDDGNANDGWFQLHASDQFTGPAGGGFWGGVGSTTDLTHIRTARVGAQPAGQRAVVRSVHAPIAHPNTLHCPPTNIRVDCDCVSGQLGLGCCVADDPILGVGELYEYLRDKREEASRTSNMAREPNNVQRKHMYQYCAVSESQ